MLKNQRGITLVALVVTIVVLIILATISISVAINGGIMNHAENAEAYQLNAEARWEADQLNMTAYIDSKLPSEPSV